MAPARRSVTYKRFTHAYLRITRAGKTQSNASAPDPDSCPRDFPELTARLVVLTAAVATLVVAVGAAPASAAVPCWKRLLNDWYDGRIDNAYPVSCYRAAIRNLPEDVKAYSSAQVRTPPSAPRRDPGLRRNAPAGHLVQPDQPEPPHTDGGRQESPLVEDDEEEEVAASGRDEDKGSPRELSERHRSEQRRLVAIADGSWPESPCCSSAPPSQAGSPAASRPRRVPVATSPRLPPQDRP